MSNHIQLIEVPKWGLSMEEGTIGQWLIEEGDSFEAGTELVEIESSKIVNTLEAHFSGTLRRILGAAGEILPVGMPIGIAADESVTDEEIDKFIASLAQPLDDPMPTEDPSAPATMEALPIPESQAKITAPKPITSVGKTEVPKSLQHGDADSDISATLHARRMAKHLGINLNNVMGTGRNDRISRKDLENAIIAAGGSVAPVSLAATQKPTASTKDDSQVPATPVARRLAAQLGINLHDCRASGSHGRVSKFDVEALHTLTTSTSKPTTEVITLATNEFTQIPIDGMRRTIGTRLQRSKQTTPHFRLTIDVDIGRMLVIRKKLNASNPDAHVSVNDFLIKASAAALMKVPSCNVQFDGSSIMQFKNADICVAVALENGLITPMVKAANNKGLVEISNEVRSLVTKAKAGTLTQDEFQGGTFTISNLGMFDIRQFDAIVNPPQCAILAVGSGEQRVVVKNGEPAVATMLTLTLCSDHRVIDGALGARFLQALKYLVEDPAMMVA